MLGVHFSWSGDRSPSRCQGDTQHASNRLAAHQSGTALNDDGARRSHPEADEDLRRDGFYRHRLKTGERK